MSQILCLTHPKAILRTLSDSSDIYGFAESESPCCKSPCCESLLGPKEQVPPTSAIQTPLCPKELGDTPKVSLDEHRSLDG